MVLEDLARRSGVKYQGFYSATGIDPPEVVKFIKRHYPEIIFKRPKVGFFKSMLTNGIPTIYQRWCCKILKKDPVKKVPLNHRLLGIRAEESINRAKYSRVTAFHKGPNRGKTIYYPILRWLEWTIWDYIEKYNLPYCNLYDEGFNRIGCVICPYICNKNLAQVNRNRNRWPNFYKVFEKYAERVWEEKIKFRAKEKNFSEFIQHWYEAKKIPNIKRNGIFQQKENNR